MSDQLEKKFSQMEVFFSNKKALSGELQFLPEILDTKINSNIFSCFKSDVFLRWGLKPTKTGTLTDKLASLFNKKKIYLEDGFIRSVNPGLSGEPTISVIYDQISPYYDAGVENSFQKALNSGRTLGEQEISQAKKAIKLILDNKISKFNHSPVRDFDIDFNSGSGNSGKILIIDQREGDYSILKGIADKSSFERMIVTALEEYPDYEVIIKKHPDNRFENYASCISDEMLQKFSEDDRISVLEEEINPYSLLEKVDMVFTVTSFMGFEALMAGKEVHCFGMPFYGGRGLTVDHVQKPGHRSRKRSLEEIFYFAYFVFSRYYSPIRKQNCDIFGAIEYILNAKQDQKNI